MKRLNQCGQLSAVVSLAVLAFSGVSSHAGDYKAIKEIPIGGQGGFDYLTVDVDAHRLYVSHGTKAVVIDVDTDKVVGEITNTPGIHGIVIAPGTGHGFTSNGREAKASMFDLKSMETISKVATGANPDGVLYDPGQKEVYTFNGSGHSATVIDPKAGSVVATIPLSGKPESGAADPKLGRVYDNIEDKSLIDVIDTKTHKVVASWPIAPAGEAAGMAIDAEHHRLFIGCHTPALMEMIDAESGKVVGSVPIGADTDASAFDPGSQLAFSSCRDGTVTIAHEDAPDKLTAVQTLKTQAGARTMTVDTRTHKIYLAVGSGETFKVLVYGM